MAVVLSRNFLKALLETVLELNLIPVDLLFEKALSSCRRYCGGIDLSGKRMLRREGSLESLE